MRIYANLFLILFVADGGFSLVDELVSLLTPLMPFSDLRNLLAITVIVMSVPIYLSLGIDRRLPKRVFLPLILFVLWSLVSTSLFPILAKFQLYCLVMAAMQVAIGMLPLACFRRGSECCLTIPPTQYGGSFFSRNNTLAFCAVNVFIVPIILLLAAFTVANAYMAEYTAGFMRLAPAGLTMTERTYTRGDRTIRLAAMIHVGDKEYYDTMADSVTPGQTIVLAEGVSDNKHLLRSSIDYGEVAGSLGLVSQEKLLFRGALIDEDEFEAPCLPTSGTGGKGALAATDILRSDVDISDLQQATIIFLNAVGEHLHKESSFVTGALALNDWAEKNITPDMNEIIMNDILHRRNLTVLRHLDTGLKRYDTIIIPWGALHMKEIEADVLKRGFVLQKERERISIDFRKMVMI